MELNKKKEEDVSEITSPDVGLRWNIPMCAKCKYCQGRNCGYYKTERLNAGVDIFNCPSFSEKEELQEKRAMDIMGVK